MQVIFIPGEEDLQENFAKAKMYMIDNLLSGLPDGQKKRAYEYLLEQETKEREGMEC